MSAVECARKQCRTTPCERYVPSAQSYLCGRCYDELLRVKQTWAAPMSAAEMLNAVKRFIRTPVGTYCWITSDRLPIDRMFDRLTEFVPQREQ